MFRKKEDYVLYPKMKISACILSLVLLAESSAISAFSVSSVESELSADEAKNISGTPPLDKYYIVNEGADALVAGVWTLSSAQYSSSELPNNNQDNLMIYGQFVIGPSNAGGSTSSYGEQCTAFFGTAECSCSACTSADPTDPASSWDVNSGYVFFECPGIIERRTCTGTTAPSSAFPTDHKCFFEQDAFQGTESCFTDDPNITDAPAPTAAPTESSAYLKKHYSMMMVLLPLCALLFLP